VGSAVLTLCVGLPIPTAIPANLLSNGTSKTEGEGKPATAGVANGKSGQRKEKGAGEGVDVGRGKSAWEMHRVAPERGGLPRGGPNLKGLKAVLDYCK